MKKLIERLESKTARTHGLESKKTIAVFKITAVIRKIGGIR